jgi:transposase
MSNIKLLGVDIAKSIFHMHGVDEKGHGVLRKKVTRKLFLETLLQVDCETIAMEACGGANYWARELKKQGRIVKLISPQFVKPFVKRNKNDYNDAEAICEAASRPNMNFVEPLTEDRQDIQSIHRIRQGLIDARTACGNRVRGLLAEYGEVVSLGVKKLMVQVEELLGEGAEHQLTPLIQQLLSRELNLLKDYTKRVKECDILLSTTCETNEICQRLSEMPGVGLINATILYVKLGAGLAFKNGRHFAAYLGLTPKQHSSGGKEVLLGISKQGDSYVRKNLIHGGRSILRVAGKRTDSLSQWAMKLYSQKKWNVVAVAIANKLARIAWCIVKENRQFELNPVLTK